MKIVFFSQDDELEDFLQDAQTSADVVMTDAEKDAIAEVEEAMDEEIPVALFLDFDTSRKGSEKLNKHFLKKKEVARIVFTESMSVKELKKHQDSKVGANAYMRKPLGAEAISELLEDLGLVDEAVFEFEKDELFDSIPAGSSEIGHDEDDSSQSQANFSAAELKMDTRVRYQLDRHNFNPDETFDFKGETNVRIQTIFDTVLNFEELDEAQPETDGPDDSDEFPQTSELDEERASSDEDQSIVFDFGDAGEGDEDEMQAGESMSAADDQDDTGNANVESENPREILEQMESEREASLVGYRPPVLEATGDIEIPEEFRNASVDSEDDEDILADLVSQDDEDAPILEEEGGLEFGLPEDGQAVGADDLSFDSEEEEPLDLGADDGDALSLGSSDDEDNVQQLSADSEEDDDGMLLDMGEDEGALEFSNAQEDVANTSESEDELDDGGLDLDSGGDELEIGAADEELDLGGAEISSEDDEDFGALDLDAADDEEIEKTVVMSADDAGLNFAMGEEEAGDTALDTSDINFDTQLSETDLAADEDDTLGAASEAEVNLDDALSGVTGESLEEFDYTGANEDLAALSESDEEEEFSGLEDFGANDIDDGTDPTMLAGILSEEDLIGATEDLQGDELTDLAQGAPESDGEQDFDESLLTDSAQSATPVAAAAKAPTRGATDPILVQTYAQEEMVRHQGLIKQLREEREDLLKQITDLKTSVRLAESENLGLRAELDELKIEKSIMKKRSQQEFEEMRYSLKLADEKRDIFEERSRKVQKEFDKLNHKVRIDFNTVKQREKELEGQLELLKMDSRSQVESRDKKILELKRKIDALEFNMENAHIKEQKSKEDKVKLEEKLHKVMKTLRSSIKVMEDDLEVEGILSDRYEGSGENEASE